jgi:hypothetical protein
MNPISCSELLEGKQAGFLRESFLIFLLALGFGAFLGVPGAAFAQLDPTPIDGRVFEFVPVPGGISWENANSTAQSLSYQGEPGGLATIDSLAVHNHVVAAFGIPSNTNGAPWIGAYSPTGSNDPNVGWFWVSGEPWAFTKWIPGEPSGWSGNPPEGATINGTVGWNDVPPQFFPRGFVVEYLLVPVPSLSCVGFGPPMANYPVKAKKNRAFPLKMEMFGDDGFELTDLDVHAPPVVQVIFAPASGDEPFDVSDDVLSSGQGSEGNQFVFTDDGIWQFNLKSTNYSAEGEYMVAAVSGDESEYTIDPSCVTSFAIQ